MLVISEALSIVFFNNVINFYRYCTKRFRKLKEGSQHQYQRSLEQIFPILPVVDNLDSVSRNGALVKGN